MFTGEYRHTVDGKGRISVPSDIREILRVQYDGHLVITKALLGRCLWAFPQVEWTGLAQKIAGVGVGNRQLIKLKRRLFPAARTCPVDRAGRILVPESLRQHAGIEREATFVAVGKYIELWRPDLWAEEADSLDDDESTDALLETMAELGL